MKIKNAKSVKEMLERMDQEKINKMRTNFGKWQKIENKK